MSKPNRCFISFRPSPHARARLFCFPYAGGGAHVYRGWGEVISPSVELYAAQYPGRGPRLFEEPFDSLEELVDESARALLAYADKPFAFFGHSMGALLCFEVARRLRADGMPLPFKLFVSGRGGPQKLRGRLRRALMSDEELIEELGRMGVSPDVLSNAELMQMTLPYVRADFTACERYVYSEESPLPCPITAYGGSDDAEAGEESLSEWRGETSASFSCRIFPGDHFFLDTARAPLLRAVRAELEASAGY